LLPIHDRRHYDISRLTGHSDRCHSGDRRAVERRIARHRLSCPFHPLYLLRYACTNSPSCWQSCTSMKECTD